jgi:hypothetical protein
MAFYPSIGWGVREDADPMNNSFVRNRENNRNIRKTMRDKIHGEDRVIGHGNASRTHPSFNPEKFENHFQMHRDARRDERFSFYFLYFKHSN